MRALSLPALLLLLGLAACARKEDPVPPPRREAVERPRPADPEQGTVARKAGRVAYGAAQESKQVAKKAGKAIWKASKEAGAGWKEAQREAARDRR